MSFQSLSQHATFAASQGWHLPRLLDQAEKPELKVQTLTPYYMCRPGATLQRQVKRGAQCEAASSPEPQTNYSANGGSTGPKGRALQAVLRVIDDPEIAPRSVHASGSQGSDNRSRDPERADGQQVPMEVQTAEELSRRRGPVSYTFDMQGLFVLTGENMAGKSTFCRSLLALVVLANAGTSTSSSYCALSGRVGTGRRVGRAADGKQISVCEYRVRTLPADTGSIILQPCPAQLSHERKKFKPAPWHTGFLEKPDVLRRDSIRTSGSQAFHKVGSHKSSSPEAGLTGCRYVGPFFSGLFCPCGPSTEVPRYRSFLASSYLSHDSPLENKSFFYEELFQLHNILSQARSYSESSGSTTPTSLHHNPRCDVSSSVFPSSSPSSCSPSTVPRLLGAREESRATRVIFPSVGTAPGVDGLRAVSEPPPFVMIDEPCKGTAPEWGSGMPCPT